MQQIKEYEKKKLKKELKAKQRDENGDTVFDSDSSSLLIPSDFSFSQSDGSSKSRNS